MTGPSAHSLLLRGLVAGHLAIPAAEALADVLDSLQTCGWSTVAEIREHTGRPRSTVHLALRVLRARRKRDPREPRRYLYHVPTWAESR